MTTLKWHSSEGGEGWHKIPDSYVWGGRLTVNRVGQHPDNQTRDYRSCEPLIDEGMALDLDTEGVEIVGLARISRIGRKH